MGLLLLTARLVSGPFTSQSFINGRSVLVEAPTSATALTLTGTSTTPKYTNDLDQLITAGTNAAGITYGAWARPVTVRGDASGNASVNTVSVSIPSPTSTNTAVFTFQRSTDGTLFDSVTTWGFTIDGASSALASTVVTNVPTWFVTGASHIRLATILFTTNAASYTNYISSIKFNTFAP